MFWIVELPWGIILVILNKLPKYGVPGGHIEFRWFKDKICWYFLRFLLMFKPPVIHMLKMINCAKACRSYRNTFLSLFHQSAWIACTLIIVVKYSISTRRQNEYGVILDWKLLHTMTTMFIKHISDSISFINKRWGQLLFAFFSKLQLIKRNNITYFPIHIFPLFTSANNRRLSKKKLHHSLW